MDFNKCTLGYLEDTFGLIPIDDESLTQEWLSAEQELAEFEMEDCRRLRDLLKDNVSHWNEQELSMHFIGPVFSLIYFTKRLKYNLFAERVISSMVADINNDLIELSGRPDGIVASGYQSPKVPFFCFQEYKKEKDPDGDPDGQCLAAMLAGQALNESTDKPIYGCVIIGQNWKFLVLQNRNYAISAAYSALTDDVFEIARILKVLKQYVELRAN